MTGQIALISHRIIKIMRIFFDQTAEIGVILPVMPRVLRIEKNGRVFGITIILPAADRTDLPHRAGLEADTAAEGTKMTLIQLFPQTDEGRIPGQFLLIRLPISFDGQLIEPDRTVRLIVLVDVITPATLGTTNIAPGIKTERMRILRRQKMTFVADRADDLFEAADFVLVLVCPRRPVMNDPDKFLILIRRIKIIRIILDPGGVGLPIVTQRGTVRGTVGPGDMSGDDGIIDPAADRARLTLTRFMKDVVMTDRAGGHGKYFSFVFYVITHRFCLFFLYSTKEAG